MNNQIVLGSGDLYVVAYTGTIPSDEVIETEENRVGYIKGGASLEYAPEELEIKDDSGVFIKRYITSEETTFKSGILTWDLEVLNKLTADGTYTDDTSTKVRTVSLGGVGAREMKQYLIRFVHSKDATNKIRITLVGTSSAGFELKFASDEETTIDAEFKAIAQNSTGTQVIITETYTAE